MRALLNTLGATVWGLIAIILAAAVATLSYRRGAAAQRRRGTRGIRPAKIGAQPEPASPQALGTVRRYPAYETDRVARHSLR